MKTVPVLFALLACSGFASLARAQTPDPRDYEIGYFAPTRTALANLYLRQYGATDGGSLQQSILAFRGTYILKFGHLVFTPLDVVVPVVDATAHIATGPSPLTQTTRGSGVGDVLYLPTIGYGFTQNEENHTHTWMALTTYVTLPVGKYRKKQLVNVSRHRWEVNPLVVIGQRFLKAITVEAMGSIGMYADNDKYRVPTLDMDLTLKQDMSYGASFHLAIDLHPTFYIAGSYYLAVSGEQTTELPTGDEHVVEEKTTVHSFRLNLGIRLSKTTVIAAQLNEEFDGSDDARLGRFFGLRLSHGFTL